MKKEAAIVIALLAVMIMIVAFLITRILNNPGIAVLACIFVYFALSDGK